ncbi:MAG: hypothetical protein E6560_17845 [Yersiniaceae bacterium]|nr:hypothetical protein [Yersiniaceae bacterium]
MVHKCYVYEIKQGVCQGADFLFNSLYINALFENSAYSSSDFSHWLSTPSISKRLPCGASGGIAPPRRTGEKNGTGRAFLPPDKLACFCCAGEGQGHLLLAAFLSGK